MKKRIIFLLILLAAFTLFGVSRVHAAAPTPKVTPAPNKLIVQKVDYVLPYPGIGPDSSLYFLKAGRDKLLEWLIVDPTRKAEFYILQGDKRLAMGIVLTDKGNVVLAEQVISKGEKYLNQALTTLTQLKQSGQTISQGTIDHLDMSLAKHSEVLTDLIAKASEPQKTGLTGSLDLVKRLQTELAKLK